MAISKAQQRAVAKYNAKAYDRIEIKVPKGLKSSIQDAAKAKGYDSLNAYTKALYEADSGLSMDIKQTAEE